MELEVDLSMTWHLIGWCRLRNGYRNFRADRIMALTNTQEVYEARSETSLQEYFNSVFQTNQNLTRAFIVFDKSTIRSRSLYGCVSQEDLGDRMRAEFMIDSINYMANWLLMFGTKVTVESPEELKLKLAEITEDLYNHYSKTAIDQAVSVTK